MNILALADLHGRLPKLPKVIFDTEIDLLLLCGDILPNEIANWDMSNPFHRVVNRSLEGPVQLKWFNEKFLPWTKKFKAVKKIVFVYGNHEFLDKPIEGIECQTTGSRVIEVDGLKIGLLAGSMTYTGEWNDEVDEYEMQQRILNMDPDIDILVSHVPPLGIMDKSFHGEERIGCNSLRDALLGITSFGEVIEPPYFRKVKYHLFGHCHERRGMDKIGEVTFLNVAETYCCLETSGNDLQHHPSRVSFHSK